MERGFLLNALVIFISLSTSLSFAECMLISSSGSYVLTNNSIGAPNPVSGGLPVTSACIIISSSNVSLDCNGHNITNNGTLGAAGIFVNGSMGAGLTNVTIQNCPGISGYVYGAYIGYAGSSILRNSTAYGNTYAGFYVTISNQNTFEAISADNNSLYGFYLNGSSGNTISGSSARNSSNIGFYLSASNSTNLSGNTAYENGRKGFRADYSYYNSFSGNLAYNNSEDGFFLYHSHNNSIRNNNASFNNWSGIYLYWDCNQNNVSGNRAFLNNQQGIYLNEGSERNNISGNLAYNNSQSGFYTRVSNLNMFSDNHAHGNMVHGYVFSSSGSDYETLAGNHAYDNSATGFYIAGSNNNITGNYAFNNTQHGLILNSASNNSLSGNHAHNNSLYGFYVYQNSRNNSLAENYAYGNSQGFYLNINSSNNSLSGNYAYGNTNYGFYLNSNSSNNTIEGNHAYGNTRGFEIDYGQNNSLSGNYAYDNTQRGFTFIYSPGNILSGNHAYNNLRGFHIAASPGNTLFDNEACNNSQYGLFILTSDATNATNTHLYNNGYDAYLRSVSVASVAHFQNLTIDSPSGDFSEYSSLSITDYVDADTAYSIGWASNSSPVPPGRLSFTGKFVNISNQIGATSIDAVIWHWSDSESAGHNESKFELWKYSGSAWSMLNATPDTSANTLSQYNMNPASDYGILENNATPLAVTLNSPGNGETLTSNTVNLVCSATGNGLQNLTLYGDWGGWHANETAALSGDDDSHIFTKTLPDGTYSWNCLAYDLGNSTFAPANFTFTINTTMPNVTITLHAANVTLINTSKYSSNITAGNIVTEGGNITQVNLDSNVSTEKWAGFYGNVSASLILSENNATSYMYQWAWNSSNGGVVCLSINSTLSSFSAVGANAMDIDSTWGFSTTDTDSAANTYNGTGCSLEFGTTIVSNASYADTGNAGGFTTCALKTALSPSKPEMLFCVNITYNGAIYNGKTWDFELIVPTSQAANTFETYYFYMSLD